MSEMLLLLKVNATLISNLIKRPHYIARIAVGIELLRVLLILHRTTGVCVGLYETIA